MVSVAPQSNLASSVVQPRPLKDDPIAPKWRAAPVPKTRSKGSETRLGIAFYVLAILRHLDLYFAAPAFSTGEVGSQPAFFVVKKDRKSNVHI